MRRLFVLLILASLLAACGGGSSSELPTRLPTVDTESIEETIEADESPRGTPDTGLPATWTPSPTDVPATPVPVPDETEAATSPDGQTYTVQVGDTLAEIAQSFNVSLDALAEANGIEDINVIEVGQVLVIP